MHVLNFDTEDSIPDILKEFAKPLEGDKGFAVTLVPQQKLNEFRDTNTNIVRERDALKGVISKLSPLLGDTENMDETIENLLKELPELKDIKQQVEDGKLQGSKKIQEEVENRIGAMKAEHENAIKHLGGLLDEERKGKQAAEHRFKQTQIDRAVTEAVIKPDSGARKDALGFFLREAYDVFKVDDKGHVVPYDRDGKIIYGSDGATPMSPGEWLKHQAETSPFLFEGSKGGGAQGGDGGNIRIDPNLPPEERLRMAREARG
jgi:hypothetical protein